MHALVLMMVAIGGDPSAGWAAPDNAVIVNNALEMEHTGSGFGATPYHYDPPRDPQESDGLVRGFFKYCCAWFQPMPQTCYGPHFGCYPGNGRDIQRYPAFHGYYYRQAYNYRPLFEYPWQANMHEPLPLENSSPRSLAGKLGEPTGPTEIVPPPANPSRVTP